MNKNIETLLIKAKLDRDFIFENRSKLELFAHLLIMEASSITYLSWVNDKSINPVPKTKDALIHFGVQND
jgi:hypothetical protein